MNPKLTFTPLQIRIFLTAIWPVLILPVSAATFDSATSNNWNLATTWTLTSGTDADGVPDADDAVTIKAGHNVNVISGSACTTITVEATATLTLSSSLNNSGAFLNQGTLEWTGALTGAGALTNDGTINFSGIVSTLHNTDSDITNNPTGTINWLIGYIDGNGGGQTLTNYGIFNLIGDNPSSRNCAMAIINKSGGSIIKGGTTSAGLSIDKAFTNESGGMVTIQSGASISFVTNISFTQDGAFTVDGTLNLGNSMLSQSQVFSVNGTCNITTGTHAFGAGFSGSGTLIVSGGTLTFDAGSTLPLKLTQSNGTLNDNVGLMPGEVTLTGGIYQGSGSPTFANGFTWNGGILGGSGTVTVGGNFVSSTGNPSLSGSKELRITGTGTITANASRALGLSSTGILSVAPTGSLTFDGSSTMTVSGGASSLFTFENGSSLTKTGSGSTAITCPLAITTGVSSSVNNGALNIGTSSFTYNFTGGTVNVASPGSFNLSNGTFNLSDITVSGTGIFGSGGTAVNVNAGTSITSKLSITGGNFNDNIGLMPGEVTLSGNYQGTGSPTFANGFIWNTGNLAGSGIVTVSGAMTASSAGSRFIQGTKELHLSGTGTITNVGINISNGTKLLILNGGTLTIDLPGSTATLGNGNTSIIEVQTGGSLIKTGSNQLNIGGQFLLSGGSLTISDGIFNVTALATHTYSGGTVVVNGTGDFKHSNGNTANFSNVPVSGSGTFSTSGTINFNTGSSLTCKLSITGTVNDNVGLMPGEVTLTSGVYGGTGSPTFANGFIWNGGQLNGSGMLTMSGNMTGTNGSRSLFGSKILRITGTGTFTGGGIQLAQTSSLLIANGGALTIDNTAGANISMNASAPPATMEVQAGGNFTKTGAGTLIVSNAPFVNNGLVTVSNGELNLSNNTTHSGNFDIATGATLNFSNTSANTILTGVAINNNGKLSVASGRSLVFGGTTTQTLSGNGLSIAALTINNAADVSITGSQDVSGAMTLTSGKVYLQNGDLIVGALSGGDANRYFITSGTGRLIQSVSTLAQPFPVGPSNLSYNPVTLQQTSGTASFGVRVKQGFDYPTNGDGYVDRQWTIDHTGGTANTNITFQWSPSDATMTFDPDNCHISRHTGSSWNPFGNAAATCGSTCTRTQSGVTQFSPFGIGTGAALPVELVNFEGLLRDEMVLLKWQTASELNAAWYEVERSSDGLRWANIGKVAAQGNTTQGQGYTFEDLAPLPLNYYRLRMEDLDGSFEYSPIVSVKMESKVFLLENLYPNPVSTALTIQFFSPKEGDLQFKITDVSGKIRRTERIHTPVGFFDKILNVIELEPGIYFLEVNMDEKISVHRFAKR